MQVSFNLDLQDVQRLDELARRTGESRSGLMARLTRDFISSNLEPRDTAELRKRVTALIRKHPRLPFDKMWQEVLQQDREIAEAMDNDHFAQFVVSEHQRLCTPEEGEENLAPVQEIRKQVSELQETVSQLREGFWYILGEIIEFKRLSYPDCIGKDRKKELSREWRRAGASYREIAEALNVAKTTVMRWLKDSRGK